MQLRMVAVNSVEKLGIAILVPEAAIEQCIHVLGHGLQLVPFPRDWLFPRTGAPTATRAPHGSHNAPGCPAEWADTRECRHAERFPPHRRSPDAVGLR